MMINDKADKVIKKLSKSFLNRYQNNLGKLMKGSELVFDYVHLLYYRCHKINPNHVWSYTDSSKWIKKKKPKQILSIKKIINVFNTNALKTML